jgi:hypothetical protein
MMVSRASVFACLIGLIHLSPFNATAQAIESPSTYPEAIGFFAQEKTIGESGAALLKTFREKMAIGDYVGGVQRYAKAKAAFDGLIRQLDAEAGEVQDRANSERFQMALRQAAEARIAFTQYVEATLGPKLEGTKFPFVVIFETVAELLPKLVDAWNQLWDARRQAQHARIQEVRRQLDTVTWRPFNDVETIQ